MLLATSLIGSYSFMRGFSIIFGGFPDEIEIYELLKSSKSIDDIKWSFWVYLVLFALVFLYGAYF